MPIVNIQITREGTLPEAYAQPVEYSRADCNSRLIRCTTAHCSDFGNRSCRPTAIRMRANGTRCDPSDVDRLADGNQVVRRSMRNTMGTEQKVAVITGASQGFGAALVKAYRDRNYRVIANSRSIKPSKDSDVLAIAGDVADPKTADRIVQDGLARFGRIDTLINNAGIFIAKPLVDYTEEDYASMLATNLGGFFRVTKRVAAEMLKQGSGHIVQITTSLIDHANSNVPSVLASLTKGGLNAA